MTLRDRTREALGDSQLRANLRSTLGLVAHLQQQAVADVDNWEELREHARRVKAHTLARLGTYLGQLEERVAAQGGSVVWAETAQQAARFIVDLAHRKELRKAVKSKTMTGEEIHLNRALERARVEAVETDLGEYIVQMAGQTPSHIIAPALHLSKRQVSELFTEKLGMAPSDDVEEITRAARRVLREQFLSAPLGITGANFAVAESGTVVVVENEGNARLTVSAPRVHVVLMGIEKVIPRLDDLPVFLKLLTRSATGQKISSYVNLINGPRRAEELDGPGEYYLVLLDNGRSAALADDRLRPTLSCLRCGACLNHCPVYQNVGGHAYGSTYQGPIGAILTPQIASEDEAPEHPFASSLCGACRDVCPVKIDIPGILLELRRRRQKQKNARASRLPLEQAAMKIWSRAMCTPESYNRLWAWAKWLFKALPGDGRRLSIPPFSRWSAGRDLPAWPEKSFRQLYRETEEGGG